MDEFRRCITWRSNRFLGGYVSPSSFRDLITTLALRGEARKAVVDKAGEKEIGVDV